MPQVAVTIAGRVYRMACGEGEEDHLHGLAGALDARIAALRTEFGEIGDQRITIMAAITIADDLSDAHKRVAALETKVGELSQARAALEAQVEATGTAVAAALDEAATRIDRLARTLGEQDAT